MAAGMATSEDGDDGGRGEDAGFRAALGRGMDTGGGNSVGGGKGPSRGKGPSGPSKWTSKGKEKVVDAEAHNGRGHAGGNGKGGGKDRGRGRGIALAGALAWARGEARANGEAVPVALEDSSTINPIRPQSLWGRSLLMAPLARVKRRIFMSHPFYFTHHPPSTRVAPPNIPHPHR